MIGAARVLLGCCSLPPDCRLIAACTPMLFQSDAVPIRCSGARFWCRYPVLPIFLCPMFQSDAVLVPGSSRDPPPLVRPVHGSRMSSRPLNDRRGGRQGYEAELQQLATQHQRELDRQRRRFRQEKAADIDRIEQRVSADLSNDRQRSSDSVGPVFVPFTCFCPFFCSVPFCPFLSLLSGSVPSRSTFALSVVVSLRPADHLSNAPVRLGQSFIFVVTVFSS